jgi:hypothetical protein
MAKILDHIALPADVRVIFGALLVKLEENIREIES